MPIYKGTNEDTSGNLYKGSTEIQDGYKATNPFYVNEITVLLTAPAGWTLSASSFTGVPGTSSGSFTLSRGGQGSLTRQTGTAASTTITGTNGLSFVDGNPTVGGGLNNSYSIPVSFTFPSANVSSVMSITGVTSTTYIGHITLTGTNKTGGTASGCGNVNGQVNWNSESAPWNGYTLVAGSTAGFSATCSSYTTGFYTNPSGSSDTSTFTLGGWCNQNVFTYNSQNYDTSNGGVNQSVSVSSNHYVDGSTTLRRVDFDGDYAYAGYCSCAGVSSVCYNGTLGGCGQVAC
jgi:hypothetical protein